MSQQELLKRVIEILDARKIAYMVTGSVTSSLQGEPRSTHDIDLVIDVVVNAALMKLRWAILAGGSEKQFTDALRVYEVQHGVLDLEYLNEWAARIGVEALWRRLCDEAMPL
jgi:hypothetical protein